MGRRPVIAIRWRAVGAYREIHSCVTAAWPNSTPSCCAERKYLFCEEPVNSSEAARLNPKSFLLCALIEGPVRGRALSIPGYLIPIIAVLVVALIAVILGVWLLFTNKLEEDEVDRADQRPGRSTIGAAPEQTDVLSSANRPSIPERDSAQRAEAQSGEKAADDAGDTALSGDLVYEDPECRRLAAFVDENVQYYLNKWAPLLQSRTGSAGFNWAAFFLTGFWLPYRRMYKAALILYAAVIVEAALEEVVFVGVMNKTETPQALGTVVTLAVSLICGAYGNRWYLAHARAAVSKNSREGLPRGRLVGRAV